MDLRFQDRHHAGRVLAKHLLEHERGRYAGRTDVLVLALPRGGVPVGYEVARALPAALDVWLVRKLGVPGHDELAMGAIAGGGARFINEELVRYLGVSRQAIERVAREEELELARRTALYRGDRPPPIIAGRTVILVDDGLATGASMRVAVSSVRLQRPDRIVVAVPIAPPETCEELAAEVDEVICPRRVEPFVAVGRWYEDFLQTTDEEVRALLDRAAQEPRRRAAAPAATARSPQRG